MYQCAGIVFWRDNKVLLGKQRKDGTWSSFGGRGVPPEAPAQTAARECYEELRGSMAQRVIEDGLSGVEPLVSDTPSGARFFLYMVHVDSLEKIQAGFDGTKSQRLPRCMREISEVCVFRVEDLHGASLRPPFRKELRQVIEGVQRHYAPKKGDAARLLPTSEDIW